MEQIGGALIGGLLGGDEGGGSQTSQREPWKEAQPWLKDNIKLGQQLQNQYMQNPFSQQQQNAFSNAFGMSDAYRAMLPQLLQGLNGGQFDRRNPLGRPQAMNFGGFNPQFTQMGAFKQGNQGQLAQAAIPAAPTNPYFESVPMLDFSRGDFGGSGTGGGNYGGGSSDDGGTWA
jgi:hypothetical protein